MRKTFALILAPALALALALSSCTEPEKTNAEKLRDGLQNVVEKLKDEAIKIHDEVMPKMGQLKSLRKDLEKAKEELLSYDNVSNAEKIEVQSPFRKNWKIFEEFKQRIK